MPSGFIICGGSISDWLSLGVGGSAAVDGAEDGGELVGAELAQHLLLLLHVLAVLVERVQLLLLGVQLQSDVARARLQGRQGFFVRRLDRRRWVLLVTELALKAAAATHTRLMVMMVALE